MNEINEEFNKNSFVFYKSFYEAIQDLKEKDKLKMYEAICELALYGKKTELKGTANTIFKLIKPQILANNDRYKNGKKGGRPKKEETNGFRNEETIGYSKKKANENENVNDNDNVNANENDNVDENEKKENVKKKIFQKPTIEELKEYCDSSSLSVDYQYFFDYYESNGWLVGKNKMKDWRATLRNWNRKNQEKNNKTKVIREYTDEQGLQWQELSNGKRICMGRKQ